MPSGSSTIRRAALLRDRGLCCNCSQPADHTHHIVPIHLGGQDVLSNVVAICQGCHGKVHGFGYGLDHRAATKAGLNAARARGVLLGAAGPAGAAANAARTQRATARASELAEHLLPLRAQGLAYGAIADQLNANGVPTPSGTGRWAATSVSRAIARVEGSATAS